MLAPPRIVFESIHYTRTEDGRSRRLPLWSVSWTNSNIIGASSEAFFAASPYRLRQRSSPDARRCAGARGSGDGSCGGQIRLSRGAHRAPSLDPQIADENLAEIRRPVPISDEVHCSKLNGPLDHFSTDSQEASAARYFGCFRSKALADTAQQRRQAD